MRLKESSILKRFFLSRWLLICGFFVAIILATGYARAYYQDYKIKQEIYQLKTEVGRLERKKLESLDILNYVMSPSFVEEKARTELRLKKPGENIVVIEGIGTEPKNASSVPVNGQNSSNPIKWWYYFFHRS